MAEYFIGIDIGGTNVKVGVFDSDIKLFDKSSLAMDLDMAPEDIVERIAATCRQLLAAGGIDINDLAGVGIGVPGPADYPAGIVIQSTNIPKFRNIPLRNMIARSLRCGAVMENDANIACWGEFSAGAGKDVDDMVFFTLGTGVGGGIVCKGELLTGSAHNAAELGHIILYPDGRACNCGQKGCVEAYASATATAARATEAIQAGADSSLKELLDKNGQITCKDVFDHSAAGDKLAEQITEQTAKALALMCVNMLHTTEPKQIVFSGGVIAAGDALLNRIKHYFAEHIWKLKPETLEICFATLGEDTGIVGAAAFAKHAKEHGKLV